MYWYELTDVMLLVQRRRKVFWSGTATAEGSV